MGLWQSGAVKPTGRVLASVTAICLLTGCGADPEPATPTLTWVTPPDRANLTLLAADCADEADGAYRIEVAELPTDVDERRVEVLRRLRGGDPIDILGVDTALTGELAGSGLLSPIPASRADTLSDGVFDAALAASTVDGRLVTAPWWYDPQLLWFRGSSAERAALDTSQPVSWTALLDGARQIEGTVQIDGRSGEGTTAWVTALVAGAGGEVLSGEGREPRIGLDSDAGRRAADVVQAYTAAGVGPGPSDDALRAFAAPGGTFLVAPSSIYSDPVISGVAAELRWTGYPVVDREVAAPASGVGLAVPASAERKALAFDAIECLTGDDAQRTMMTGSGHAAAQESLFDDPELVDEYPMADEVRASLAAAAPEPVSRYYARLRAGIEKTWEPTRSVDDDTPSRSAQVVEDLIGGELP